MKNSPIFRNLMRFISNKQYIIYTLVSKTETVQRIHTL